MKEKLRNNKILNIGIVAILIFSVITIMAYAKYLTTINGTGSLDVAKWSFKVNDKNDSLGTIDMGRNTYTASTLTANKIAPGTSGSFDLKIDASNTEIGVDYTIKLDNIQNKPTNLYFTVDGTKLTTVSQLQQGWQGTIDANAQSKVKTVTVNWAWDYTTGTGATLTANDNIDTAEGKTANSLSFDIAVTGTQVEPQ